MHAQSCLALYNPMDCKLTGSSLHGISQARILEWVPFPSPVGLPSPGTELTSPASPTLADGLLPTEPPGKSWDAGPGSQNHVSVLPAAPCWAPPMRMQEGDKEGMPFFLFVFILTPSCQHYPSSNSLIQQKYFSANSSIWFQFKAFPAPEEPLLRCPQISIAAEQHFLLTHPWTSLLIPHFHSQRHEQQPSNATSLDN